jgi:hypothetical protein
MAEREGKSAAAAAAEQVKAIVEAAEQTAASLEAAAREDAARIRADAEAAAAGTREAAAGLVERAEALDRRLDELGEGLREALAGLKEELAALRTAGASPSGIAPAAPAAEPAPPAEPAPAGADIDETIAEAEAVAAREPEVKEGRSPAPEGARVLALKMALDGRPREETARYLRDNFELEDADALLDEVYAKASG